MKIAITGSTGFVGVHLIHHLLQSGHEIYALHRAESSLSDFDLLASQYPLQDAHKVRLHWVQCPLFDMIAMEEAFSLCDAVIHAAGMVSYDPKHRIQILESNVEMTANVANACLAARVEHLLLISSTSAVAKEDAARSVVETNVWSPSLPHSFYGLSKHQAELELWRAREEGLNITILNPGVILGFGNWNKGSLKLFKNAYKRFPFYSEGITGFVGVQDLCRVAEHFLPTPANDRFLVISENLSYKQVAFMMADAFGVRRPWVNVKGLLYETVLGLMYIKKILRLGGMLSVETTKAAVSVNHFSNEKLVGILPFRLQKIEDVILSACAAYTKNSPPR